MRTVLFVFLTLFASCSSEPEAQCQIGADCISGRCVQGQCRSAENSANSENSDDNSTPNSANSGTDALQCGSYSWCTTYSATSDEPTSPAQLTGGRIDDGVYRLEEGTFGNDAIVFQGDRALILESSRNVLGTWSSSADGVLQIQLSETCGPSRPPEPTDSPDRTFNYAVRGADLFLQSLGCMSSSGQLCPPRRYTRVTDLCETSDFFYCTVSNCGCRLRQGTLLTDEECDFNP